MEHESIPTGESFTWKDDQSSLSHVNISMFGKHQTENAALAIKAALLLGKEHSFKIGENHIREGLKKAYWPGRFELLSNDPLVVIDGAHNEEGVNALAEELKKRYSSKKKKLFSRHLRIKNWIK